MVRGTTASGRARQYLRVIAALAIAVLLLAAPAMAEGWTVETVDSSGDVGSQTSLALDTSGNPRISYYDYTNHHLKYASWTGTVWNIETVDSSAYVGQSSSLALDTSGNPRISYWDEANADLKYASWTGTAWNTETIDNTGVAWVGSPADTSLALDSSDNPRISYYDDTNKDLKYASWTGTAWNIETVDSIGKVGPHTSLALDTSGNPRISYYDFTNYDLKYASWTGTAWNIETVDSSGSVGMHTSLALDTSGNPHISYYDDTNENLKYASWTGTAWNKETVDSSGDVGWYTSLALDSSDNPRISYFDFTNGDLKYASWTGTAWNINTVDSSGFVGAHTSLALDTSDNPRISYYDATNDDLKYATPLIVSFSATPVSGSAPLTVAFTDTTPEILTSRVWSFGDGETSFTQNPSHTYTAPGSYTVSLVANVVAGNVVYGINATAARNYITVTGGPSATAIAVDPVTASNVYAGVDGSGVYYSTNSGGSWTGATTQPGNLNIRALAINPVTRSTLYTGTYGGGVYRSTDSGASWNACTNTGLANLNVLSLVTSPTGTLYAGTENGIYASTDCDAWTAQNTGLP